MAGGYLGVRVGVEYEARLLELANREKTSISFLVREGSRIFVDGPGVLSFRRCWDGDREYMILQIGDALYLFLEQKEPMIQPFVYHHSISLYDFRKLYCFYRDRFVPICWFTQNEQAMQEAAL